MGSGRKLLDAMRANPRDWRIEDVATVCAAYGVDCIAPRKGSHYKVRDEVGEWMLIVPAHKPIKPTYIKQLVRKLDQSRDGRRP